MNRRAGKYPAPQRSIQAPNKRKGNVQRKKSSVPTMDKYTMLVMEANEINSVLQKPYVFVKKDVEGFEEGMVKVYNTHMGISCMWTVTKLKERLVRMRETLYKSDRDNFGIASDTLFFDADDFWVKDDERPSPTSYPHQPADPVPNGSEASANSEQSNQDESAAELSKVDTAEEQTNQNGDNVGSRTRSSVVGAAKLPKEASASKANYGNANVAKFSSREQTTSDKTAPKNSSRTESSSSNVKPRQFLEPFSSESAPVLRAERNSPKSELESVSGTKSAIAASPPSLMSTFAGEEALPSVSISVAFQATNKSSVSELSTPEHTKVDPLGSTAGSELPGESEFISMATTTSIHSSAASVQPGNNKSSHRPISDKYFQPTGDEEKHVHAQHGAWEQVLKSQDPADKVPSYASHLPLIKTKTPNITKHPTKSHSRQNSKDSLLGSGGMQPPKSKVGHPSSGNGISTQPPRTKIGPSPPPSAANSEVQTGNPMLGRGRVTPPVWISRNQDGAIPTAKPFSSKDESSAMQKLDSQKTSAFVSVLAAAKGLNINSKALENVASKAVVEKPPVSENPAKTESKAQALSKENVYTFKQAPSHKKTSSVSSSSGQSGKSSSAVDAKSAAVSVTGKDTPTSGKNTPTSGKNTPISGKNTPTSVKPLGSPKIVASSPDKIPRTSSSDTPSRNIASASKASSNVESPLKPRHSSIRHSPQSVSKQASAASGYRTSPEGAQQMDEDDVRYKLMSRRKIPMLRLCRDMLDTLTRRCQVAAEESNCLDRILINCESVKNALINILEAYTSAVDGNLNLANFADSDCMKMCSLQLLSATELLINNLSLWSSTLKTLGSHECSYVSSLLLNIQQCQADLVSQFSSLLHVCESSNDIQASEEATKALDLVEHVVQLCGQLSLATGTSTQFLQPGASLKAQKKTLSEKKKGKDDDLLNMMPDLELRQFFVVGYDSWLQQVLAANIQSVEEWEAMAKSLVEASVASKVFPDVVQNVEVTVATTKKFIVQCHRVQEELHTDLTTDYYQDLAQLVEYAWRCGELASQLGHLHSAVSFLCQCTETLLSSSDEHSLRKVCRCAEMTQKAAIRLLNIATCDKTESSVTSVNSSISEQHYDLNSSLNVNSASLVLSQEQIRELDLAADDVKLGAQTLISIVKKKLPVVSLNQTITKAKRMLPMPPGSTSNMMAPRSKSANTQKRAEQVRRSKSVMEVPNNQSPS